jgi:hypothetical protein
VAVEEWLVERGYLAPANVGLAWGTYTITPAGLDGLRGGMPEPLEAPQKATEPATGPQPHPSAEENSEGRRGSWWKRWFGG